MCDLNIDRQQSVILSTFFTKNIYLGICMCRKPIRNDVFANLIRSSENSSWNYENKKNAYFLTAS